MKINGLFELGQIVATPEALQVLERCDTGPADLLRRHRSGDWGDIDAEDKAVNERAVKDGDRILSVYNLSADATIWIITEADRSSTLFLLPADY